MHDKYRCDQMVLEHNNEPIDYEQILLPVPTTKKYFTGHLNVDGRREGERNGARLFR